MARTHLDLKTVRNPVKLVRATEIKAKFDDFDDALDAALLGEYLGAPDLATDNYYKASGVMQATAYTLAQTAPPADNPPRNVTLTHTTDTTTDTLGDAVVVGTDYEDNPITETIPLVADSEVQGTKAFKTIVSVTTPDWVIAGGVADLIEIGFGKCLGLSRRLSAASQVFMATLNGVALLPVITVDATLIEENTIDLSAGTYDSAKLARALLFGL